MYWQKMTDRQKTEYIVQNVMQWKYFPSWELKHTARWVLHEEPTWPYAFWDEQEECVSVFYAMGEDARPFSPLVCMDDAWKIVEWSSHLPGGLRWQFNHILELLLLAAWREDRAGYTPRLTLDWMTKLTPAMLCEAAWQLLLSSTKEKERKHETD